MYNIEYDRGDGSISRYLHNNVNKDEAEYWCSIFVNKYVGKPYPNGKGCYPFTNAKVVKV